MLFLYSKTLLAQEEFSLNPVTVTATISPKQISKTGRNVVVIGGEMFAKLPVNSIDELLRYIPGVEVQARGAQGSQSDIVLRGGTFQQVLVVLDGNRLNDPNTGHFNSYIPIAASEIDRIEVLKGASSAIYGSEAVGGVINIVTKSFAAKKGSSRRELELEAAAGSYELFQGRAGGLYQQDELVLGGGVLSNNSIGQLQRGTRGFFNNTTASLSAKHFLGKRWSIAARSSYDSRDFGAQNFYTSFASDTAAEKVNTFWNQLQALYSKGKHQLAISSGYKSVDDTYAYNKVGIPNNNRSYLAQLLVTDQYAAGENTTVVSGVQYQRKWIKSNDRGDHEINQAAAFMILDQSIKALNFSPSLRLDYNELSGTELIPQINISYTVGKFQLRGSAGKTRREASFTEQYNNYNKALVTGGSVGNPELVAERSSSYEAGADLNLNKTFRVSFSGFLRNQSDVIDYVPTPYAQMPRKVNLSPTGTFALATNVEEVRTKGLELDVQYAKAITSHRQLYATLGLLLMKSESNTPTSSFYISSHARMLANFNLNYTCRNLAIAINGIYKQRAAQSANAINAAISKEYFVTNLKVSGFTDKGTYSVFAAVDNLFDKSYSDLLGSRMPGRFVKAGLGFRIK